MLKMPAYRKIEYDDISYYTSKIVLSFSTLPEVEGSGDDTEQMLVM